MAVCSTCRRASGPRTGIPGGSHARRRPRWYTDLGVVQGIEARGLGAGQRGNAHSMSN